MTATIVLENPSSLFQFLNEDNNKEQNNNNNKIKSSTQIVNDKKNNKTFNKRIRLMDLTNLSAITSRAAYQLRVINDGYSQGDCHRKHIKKRFEVLSRIDFSKGQRLPCDKCCF